MVVSQLSKKKKKSVYKKKEILHKQSESMIAILHRMVTRFEEGGATRVSEVGA